MRLLTLNTLTGAATLLLLVVLALPAKHALDDGAQARAAAPSVGLARYEPARHPARVFGVYVDPWHVDDWARAIGAAPQAIAKFEAFSRRRTLDDYAAESRRRAPASTHSLSRSLATATSTSRAVRRTATSCASRGAWPATRGPCGCATRTR